MKKPSCTGIGLCVDDGPKFCPDCVIATLFLGQEFRSLTITHDLPLQAVDLFERPDEQRHGIGRRLRVGPRGLRRRLVLAGDQCLCRGPQPPEELELVAHLRRQIVEKSLEFVDGRRPVGRFQLKEQPPDRPAHPRLVALRDHRTRLARRPDAEDRKVEFTCPVHSLLSLPARADEKRLGSEPRASND
ncbi:hypothetical protein [Ciceribacter thiooxidans]|uniref:Uncharacterized protein n=1 Tax=Ciceribacter thiooxidans TaxID=1969821 RepID=A0ABV7I5Z7_9HYPH|nr:hypothetical protein [Ciceribacter thiooxidans]